MAVLNRLTTAGIRVKIDQADPHKDLWLNDGGGLWLHVRPAGGRAWRLRYTAAGRRRILDIGDGFVKTLAEARLDATRHRLLIDQGIDPIEQAKTLAEEAAAEAERLRLETARRMTFAKAVDQWKLHQLAGRKDGGTEAIRILTKDVLAALGDRELPAVSKRELMECLDSIVARGARRVANICLRELHQFFRWCESRDWITRDPLHGVNKKDVGGAEAERDRVLSDEEIVALGRLLPKSGLEQHTQLAVWILLSTLARAGELTQARWDDVDVTKGIWHIPATKNGLAHEVLLSDFAAAKLEELRKVTGWSAWLFPSVRKRRPSADAPKFVEHDAPMRRENLSKQIYDRQLLGQRKHRSKATHSLVLPGGNWVPHDLRRTGATMMGNLGVLPVVIERCLNHKEPSKVVRTYQRQEMLPERKAAWQMLGEHLNSLLSPAAATRSGAPKPARSGTRKAA